ncbi:MAG: [FeFe] hydrogenase H-cluster radical SAM maturase HydE [Bacteroidota bacterium]|nr:[FeFe] hydrogenase H-cluster radical SAM maturase HydE [Bacteroidota bacterium]
MNKDIKIVNNIEEILLKEELSKQDIISLLNANEHEKTSIFAKALQIKREQIGNKVWFRGLIEFSNLCSKNCFYCGIRSGNTNVHRYEVTDNEIIDAVNYAYNNQFGSIVLQAGERTNKSYIQRITDIIRKIKKLSNGELGITLSLGEQTEETYRKWFDAGAHRYLIRIEVSNRELYKKLHPSDNNHIYDKRIEALQLLQKIGYQVGTGVMIGLPFQTIENLAEDLLFFKDFGIDMIGMGPYIEHEDTPLYQYKDTLLSKKERFDLSLKMIAILRIMMKNINIAATTAMQSIDPLGREKALKVGANIIMPNLTPVKYRSDYLLYEDKPCINEEAEECKNCLEARVKMAGDEIAYGEWGDSRYFFNRQKSH